MTIIQELVASNKRLSRNYLSVTAVFTGGTHGIGLETLKAFLRYIPEPTAIIIGRDRSKLDSELQALRRINGAAKITFIEAQLSLISGVDEASELVEEQSSPHSIDLLCMSQGYAPLGPRRFNNEGLDEAMTLGVYGRVHLAQGLIERSLLSAKARVVSVLGGGHEGHMYLDDMELKQYYDLVKLRAHFTSMMTLAFDHLARQNPDMGFVHYFPGTVSTGLRTRVPGQSLIELISSYLFTIQLSFTAMTAQESGERTLGICCFGPDFEKGSFSIGLDGIPSASEKLKEYRRDEEVSKKVWSHLEGLWKKAGARTRKA